MPNSGALARKEKEKVNSSNQFLVSSHFRDTIFLPHWNNLSKWCSFSTIRLSRPLGNHASTFNVLSAQLFCCSTYIRLSLWMRTKKEVRVVIWYVSVVSNSIFLVSPESATVVTFPSLRIFATHDEHRRLGAHFYLISLEHSCLFVTVVY